jgi:hypothetical protein
VAQDERDSVTGEDPTGGLGRHPIALAGGYRFNPDNDMSVDEFVRLVVGEEKARWACDRAETEAFASLLDDLRTSGQYRQLVARSSGFRDELAFRKAVWPEFRYVNEQEASQTGSIR